MQYTNERGKMYTIEELISEGSHIINEYKKRHMGSSFCLQGILYERWMGKVAIYSERLADGIIKKELQELYNSRNKYLDTMGAEKVLGVLYALESAKAVVAKEADKVKIFISHSSKDKKYGNILLELLRGLGLNKDEIIYTSNDLYSIPLGKKIYHYLRDNIDTNVHMVFLVSNNYFKSIACMNEMGAAWLAQKECTVIGIPGFDFNCKPFQECCIDSKAMGLIMDNYIRITEFKGIVEKEFGKRIDDLEWQMLLDKYKQSLSDAMAK